jgi:hypothetical protein
LGEEVDLLIVLSCLVLVWHELLGGLFGGRLFRGRLWIKGRLFRGRLWMKGRQWMKARKWLECSR